MKRVKIIIAMVVLLVCTSGVAWAEGRYRTIEVFFDSIQFTMNGQALPITDDSLIYNGSVYVPIRALTEMLGAKVGWNSTSRTVMLDFFADGSIVKDLEAASRKGVYQYIAFENNQIMKNMIEHFQQNDMEAMRSDIQAYSDLRNYAVSMQDDELYALLDKLASSGEIVRSGMASKSLDDFSLAWSMFNQTQQSLITLLNGKLGGSQKK